MNAFLLRAGLITYFFLSPLFFPGLHAQLRLIPEPKKSEIYTGVFRFTAQTRIVPGNAEKFTVNELKKGIEQELHLQLKESSTSNSNSIEIRFLPDEHKRRSFLEKNRLDTAFPFGEEGYMLKVSSKKILLLAATHSGIFYACQTLKQLIVANSTDNTIPNLLICDYPDIPVRAWQDDISRGPIPTMDMLKEEIRTLSAYKLNFFTLYNEHVFQLEKHPGIAPADGINKQQIEELSAFAKNYHVQLIGSYQSFGHMEKTLSHPAYRHLAENNHIISPALEESYRFLADVYGEMVPVFSGRYFNINCDETFGLGEGKSKAMMDSLGMEGIYLYHINRLNTLLTPYHKSILMWGDIIAHYPDIIKKLPANITVMAWAYHAADNFENVVEPFSKTGVDFWVAPGINCWGNIFPDFRTAAINIYNMIRDGYKHHASGVINTSWDDDGLNFMQNNWHGFVWGAENSWNAPPSYPALEESNRERSQKYDRFNRHYAALFYGLPSDSLVHAMVDFSSLHQSGIREIERNGRFFEPVFPIHLDYVKPAERQNNIRLLKKLNQLMTMVETQKKVMKHHPESLDYLQLAMKQVAFTARKNMFRCDLYSFLNGRKTKNTPTMLKLTIDTLMGEAKTLQSAYELLWNRENRPWWLEVNMKKYKDLIKTLGELPYTCLINADSLISENGRKITMQSLFNEYPVVYTLETRDSSPEQKEYKGPFYIKEDAVINARVFHNGNYYATTTDTLIYHKGIGHLYKLNSEYSPYHPSYDGGGKMGLLDGRQGSASNLTSGRWQGYSGQNIDIELDLGNVQSVSSFSMGFFQNTESWVIFPRKVEVYSRNSLTEKYKLVTMLNNTIAPEVKGNLKQVLESGFTDLQTRYIKVVAYNYGKLPEWHRAGSSYDSMIFADEIIIR